MPYKIVFRRGQPRPWKVVNEDTGKIVGSSTTKAMAKKSVRARYAAKKKQLKLRKQLGVETEAEVAKPVENLLDQFFAEITGA